MFPPIPIPAPVPASVPTPVPPDAAPAGERSSDALPPQDALPPEAVQALDRLLGEGRVVAHRPCFARVFGGAACGLLLSQFWFWSGTPLVRGREGGWFWKPQREITEETGLTRAETETARRRLCALGVLEEERRGIPATLHFRLDRAAVQRRLWTHVQAQPIPAQPVPAPPVEARTGLPGAPIPQSSVRGIRTLVRGVPASKFARFPQTNTETTPERTSKKTQTSARPALPSALGEGMTGVPIGAPMGTLIADSQSLVNRSGAARLKAALEAARKASARPWEVPP